MNFSFLELAQAMTPFCIFCLFYFFYRLNRYEKFLLLYKQKRDKEQKMIAEAIDNLALRVSFLEQTLVEHGVIVPDNHGETSATEEQEGESEK